MKKLNLFAMALFSAAILTGCGGGASEEGAMKEGEKTEEKSMSDNMEEKDMKPVRYSVDTEASQVKWAGTMLGIYTHKGLVPVEKGVIAAKGNKITGGEIVIDMTTIQPTDDNYNPEEGKTKEKLAGHLASPDFFNTKEHPNARFKITGSSDDGSKIMGELTIRGNTNKATVENVKFDPASGMATGMLVFDRQKYDVSYEAAADKTLSDDIEVEINLALKEQNQ